MSEFGCSIDKRSLETIGRCATLIKTLSDNEIVGWCNKNSMDDADVAIKELEKSILMLKLSMKQFENFSLE